MTILVLGRMQKTEALTYTAGGKVKSTTSVENSLAASYRTKMQLLPCFPEHKTQPDNQL